MRPGPEVLASFGAGSDPVSLPGGEGTAWRAGEVVLKPAGDPRVARWTADLYHELALLDPLGSSAARRDPLDPLGPVGHLTVRRDPGFRVPRPLRTVAGDGAAGDWVAQDPLAGAWVAWQWLPGEPASWAGVSPLWPRLIAASRAFHTALAGRPAPPWLGRDGSQWAVGDQVAWGERDPGSVLAAAPAPLAGQLRSLLAALRPVRLPAQLIHGDLGGNVLFAPGQPPAVIDFSPYWRPAGLALAVAAVDALTWSGADPAILGDLADQPELDQLLARAHVGRLVTEVVTRAGGPDPSTGLETVAQTGQVVTSLILSRLALCRLGRFAHPLARTPGRRAAPAATAVARQPARCDIRPVGCPPVAAPTGLVFHIRIACLSANGRVVPALTLAQTSKPGPDPSRLPFLSGTSKPRW